MSILNSILRPLFDALLYPFRGLHPLVGLTVMSLLFAVLVLVILKATSNQAKLDAVKRKIHAALFEIRLFNDDLGAILRAQFDILRHNAKYLALWLVPLLWMIVPVILILGQLQFHYGYRSFSPGEKALVKVVLDSGSAAKPAAELEAPAGLRVETPPVWVPAERELTWRLAMVEPGDYELGVSLDGARATKNVQVEQGLRRRSPVRPDRDFVSQLLYPAEAPLEAGSPIESITVAYPPGDGGIGLESEWTWMIVLFVLSIVFAYALRKPFGVTF